MIILTPFLCSVEALGLTFFLWVAMLNRYSKTKIWKSSLVAALYHGPEIAVQTEDSELEGLFDMEQVADRMKVRLSDEGDGSRSKLVRTSTSGCQK